MLTHPPSHTKYVLCWDQFKLRQKIKNNSSLIEIARSTSNTHAVPVLAVGRHVLETAGKLQEHKRRISSLQMARVVPEKNTGKIKSRIYATHSWSKNRS